MVISYSAFVIYLLSSQTRTQSNKLLLSAQTGVPATINNLSTVNGNLPIVFIFKAFNYDTGPSTQRR